MVILKKKNINLNNIKIFIFFILFSLFYFTYFQSYIPDYFKADSGNIRNSFIIYTDPSYNATASFYKFFNFNSMSSEFSIQIFSWIIYVILFVTLLRINYDKEFSLNQIIYISFFTIIYGFYYTTFSKDLILILFIIIAINFYISLKKCKYLVLLILSFIYGYYFREYWEIVAIIFMLVLIRNIKKTNLLYVIIINLFIIFIYNILYKTQITNVRYNINISRIGAIHSHSIINNLISNNSFFTDIINYLYSLMSMFCPIQGITSFNVIIYYIWIWLSIYYIYINRFKVDKILLLFIFVYLNVQALFEPDFGSAFRHGLVLFPLIFLSIWNCKRKGLIK